MKQIYLLIMTMLLGLTVSMKAQTVISSEVTPNDTNKTEYEAFDEDSIENWDIGTYNYTSLSHSYPTIDICWGRGSADYDRFGIGKLFPETGLIEVKLGTTKFQNYFLDSNITEYDFSYLAVKNASIDFAGIKAEKNEMPYKMWALNLASRSGWGYKLWNGGSFVLYYGTGMTWTSMDISNRPVNASERNAVNNFHKSIRFGTTLESGVKLGITENIGVDFAYNRQIVYPRHLFFYDVVSSIAHGIPQGLASWFAKEVGEKNSKAMPIVYFVLKNAIGYGFYELRTQSMNWPVKTAKPLVYDYFNVSLSFTF